MVRWFESDFCNTKCLNKFVRKNATACHECRKELATHQIHAIKSISPTATEPHSVESMVDGQPTLAFSSASLFAAKYFCSADCLNAHKLKAVMCAYCLKPTVAKAVPVPSGSAAVEAAAHRKVAFCSEECRLLMQMSYNNHRLFVGVCDHCAKKANITQRCLVDGIDYTLCSFGCRFEFENKNEVNLGKLCAYKCRVGQVFEGKPFSGGAAFSFGFRNMQPVHAPLCQQERRGVPHPGHGLRRGVLRRQVHGALFDERRAAIGLRAMLGHRQLLYDDTERTEYDAADVVLAGLCAEGGLVPNHRGADHRFNAG